MGFRRNILVKPMVRLMKNSCLENLTEQNRENAGCMCGWNNQKSYRLRQINIRFSLIIWIKTRRLPGMNN